MRSFEFVEFVLSFFIPRQMRRRLVLLLRSSSPPPPLYRLFSCYLSHRSLTSPKEPYDPPFSPLLSSKPHKPQTLLRSIPPSTHSSEEKNDIPFHSDLPFHFRYSYSETNPAVKPIGFRESPRFSPFGPGRLDRTWDGVSAKMDMEEDLDWGDILKERRDVIGEPLTDEEVEVLVEKYRHNDCNRQINLGNSASFY